MSVIICCPDRVHVTRAVMDTRHVWSSDTCHDTVSEQPASLTSIRSDSGMNSMEYWDYTVELECIQGHSPTSGTVMLT